MLTYAIDNRLALTKLIAADGVGVEIGVHRGHYSEVLLTHSKLALLYSIDPWSRDYTRLLWVTDQETCYRETVARLRRFGDRSHILRFPSLRAVKLFDDHSLDFVFIDGLHDYRSVKMDLALWGQKVKPGGILSGHDYHYNWPGVIQAVDEYSKRHGRQITITGVCDQKDFVGTHKLLPDTPSWVIFT